MIGIIWQHSGWTKKIVCVSLQNSESSIEIPLQILKFWAENVTVSDIETLFKLQVDKSNKMGQKMWQH